MIWQSGPRSGLASMDNSPMSLTEAMPVNFNLRTSWPFMSDHAAVIFGRRYTLES